jgi:hypothetical protein
MIDDFKFRLKKIDWEFVWLGLVPEFLVTKKGACFKSRRLVRLMI